MGFEKWYVFLNVTVFLVNNVFNVNYIDNILGFMKEFTHIIGYGLQLQKMNFY